MFIIIFSKLFLFQKFIEANLNAIGRYNS